MPSLIQFCIKIDVFVKIFPKIWLAKNGASLAKVMLFVKYSPVVIFLTQGAPKCDENVI